MMPFVPWTRAHPCSPAPDAVAPLAAWVAALSAGDANAIEPIYRSESGRVYRYAVALCGNPSWAADATQEAFVALVLRPQGFDATRGTLGAYLAGVARHALAARWREVRAEQPLAEEHDSDDSPALAVSPEELLVRAQSGAEVWTALRQLPAIFREALVLVDLQERPYAEAAAIAGIELNTLRTRLHRARAKLAALLQRTSDGRSPP